VYYNTSRTEENIPGQSLYEACMKVIEESSVTHTYIPAYLGIMHVSSLCAEGGLRIHSVDLDALKCTVDSL
jgi:hypothetical protein